MQAVASLIFAVVPILLYLWVVWMMDRYDREPLSLVVLNFLWGALGAVFFGMYTSSLIAGLVKADAFVNLVAIAPVIEEIAKGSFLLWTARDRRFDNITDGVVYGMAIGLGFGMTENFLYFLSARTAGEWVQRVVLRTLYTAVMHAMATGVTGMAVGLGKYRFRRYRIPLWIGGLLVAILMHAAWNYWTTLDMVGVTMLEAVFIGVSLGVIILVMQISLFAENRVILGELQEEADRSVIPQMHLNYLPFSSRRKILGWLSPSIDRRAYVHLATRLAFRKSQMRRTSGPERERLEREVEDLRGEIAAMLQRDSQSPAAQLY
ncbi:MAG: PrsW family intramembrane metalloprotease [Bacteroidota bacterium]|nr:PrsW family intramembrane metalloprotease [Bacteroidota bacterium]